MATTSERVPAGSGVVWATSHRAAAELRRVIVYLAVASLSCAAVVTTYALAATGDTGTARESSTASAATGATGATGARTAGNTGPAGTSAPSAAEFADMLVGTTNQYAAANRHPARIANPDCVQGSVGRYMCSFVKKHSGGARECRIMQAKWTPDTASSFTVTLAGRAARCGSLREALLSLQ